MALTSTPAVRRTSTRPPRPSTKLGRRHRTWTPRSGPGSGTPTRPSTPTASYADFLADLEAGRVAPDPSAAHGFERAARDHLGAGLSAADRKLIEGVPVKVLDDAEFGRLTRSSSGQAVTIVEGGKPLVLIRESAPIAVLREEGIHAVQLLDPKFAAKAQLLDEARMVKWSSLDLRTKMQMYAAKLDLEIDAHLACSKGLAGELDQMPPGVARDALEDQVGAARRNLGNLADRRVELASFGPLDRLKARLGFGTLATRLEQPPRLFSKTAKKGTAAAKGRARRLLRAARGEGCQATQGAACEADEHPAGQRLKPAKPVKPAKRVKPAKAAPTTSSVPPPHFGGPPPPAPSAPPWTLSSPAHGRTRRV